MSNKLLEAQLKAQAAAEAAVKLQEELQAQLEAATLAAEQAQRELEEAQESIRIREEEVRQEISDGISNISTKFENFKEIIWSIPPQLTLNFIANLSDFSDKDMYLLINTNKQGKLNLEITSYTITLIDELNDKLSDLNFTYTENQSGEYILTKNDRNSTKEEISSQQEIQFKEPTQDTFEEPAEDTKAIQDQTETIPEENTALTDFENLEKDEFQTVILDKEISLGTLLEIEESLDLTQTIAHLEFQGKHLYKILDNHSIAKLITRTISPNKPLTVLSSLIKKRRIKSTLVEILEATNSEIDKKLGSIILSQQVVARFNDQVKFKKTKISGKNLKNYQLIISESVFEELFTDTLNQLNSSQEQLQSVDQLDTEIDYDQLLHQVLGDIERIHGESVENPNPFPIQEQSSSQEIENQEEPEPTIAIDAILESASESEKIQEPESTNVIDAILESSNKEVAINTEIEEKREVEGNPNVDKIKLTRFEERLIKALKGKTRR